MEATETSALPRGFGRDGYVQQLASFATLLLFNLVVPRVLGLSAFGAFTVIAGAALTIAGTLGGGFDLLALSHSGGPNQWSPRMTLRLLATKIVVLLIAAAAVAAWSVYTTPHATQANLLLAGCLLVTSGASSLLIVIFTAAHRNDIAAGVSLAHGFLYVGIPLGAVAVGVPPIPALCGGVAVSYAIAVVAELVLLYRIPTTHPARPVSILRQGLSLGSLQWFDTLRAWGPFAVGAYHMSVAEIGSAKVAFSAAAAAAGMIPSHFPSLFVRAQVTQSANPDSTKDFDDTVLAAAALSILVGPGLYVLGLVLFPSASGEFLRLAPFVTGFAALLPVYRTVLAATVAQLSASALSGRLAIAAGAMLLSSTVFARWLGGPALLLGTCVGTLAAIALLSGSMTRRLLRTPLASITATMMLFQLVAAARNAPSYLIVGTLVGVMILSLRHRLALRVAVVRLLG